MRCPQCNQPLSEHDQQAKICSECGGYLTAFDGPPALDLDAGAALPNKVPGAGPAAPILVPGAGPAPPATPSGPREAEAMPLPGDPRPVQPPAPAAPSPPKEPDPLWLTIARVALPILIVLVVGRVIFETVDRPGFMSLVHKSDGDTKGATTVVLLLHGKGESASSLSAWRDRLGKRELPAGTVVVRVEGPRSVGFFGGRAWFSSPDDLRDSVVRLTDVVGDVLSDTKLGANRLVLVGFEEGATAAFELARALPAPPGGLALLSGCEYATGDLSALATTALLVAHGRADTRCSFETSLELQEKLAAERYNVEFLPHDGGHELTDPTFDAIAELVRDVGVSSVDE